MDSPLRMRQEWPFQMYPQWSSARMPDLRASSNLNGQPCQRAHRLISGRGYGCRKITTNTAACKISPDCVKRLWRCLHHVVSRTAMNVDIDKHWNQRGLRKAKPRPHAFAVA